MSFQLRLRVRPSTALLEHPMWSETDFAYLRGRGYTNAQVLKFWDRDLNFGAKPVHWRPNDSKYLSALSCVVRR